MRRTARLACLPPLLSIAVPAVAADRVAPSVPTIEHLTLEAFGAARPTCAEWTDGCVVCGRTGTGVEAGCSLPGIACQPGPIVCKATAAAAPR